MSEMPSKHSMKIGQQNGEDMKYFQFLSLPRELRDAVYRKLLLPDYADHLCGYKIEPAILGVNRKINQEASKVLYHETKWIIFTMNHDTLPASLRFRRYPPLNRIHGSTLGKLTPVLLIHTAWMVVTSHCGKRPSICLSDLAYQFYMSFSSKIQEQN